MVTWRRAQMLLLSAQGMDVPAIAKVAFTSEDRVRDVTGNFNADGFSSENNYQPDAHGSSVPREHGGLVCQSCFEAHSCHVPRHRSRAGLSVVVRFKRRSNRGNTSCLRDNCWQHSGGRPGRCRSVHDCCGRGDAPISGGWTRSAWPSCCRSLRSVPLVTPGHQVTEGRAQRRGAGVAFLLARDDGAHGFCLSVIPVISEFTLTDESSMPSFCMRNPTRSS